MPATANDPILSITWKQVAAFRLGRQHLLERAETNELVSVAGDICGAQAQLPPAAQMALWARLRDLRSEDIEEALINRRLVKAACMRNTLFLVPSAELASFARGAAIRAEKEIHWALGKGVSENDIEQAIQTALETLDQPRTRPEIAEQACRSLGVEKQSVHGGGWGSRGNVAAVPVGGMIYPVVDLLHLAAARGVICYGPRRGNEPTFVRADAWIPDWQNLPVELAEERLLRRYLWSYGPATQADFCMWSGMNLSGARLLWQRTERELAPVSVQGWHATVLGEDLESLDRAEFDGPQVRLLPYFDTYLLGHRERTHLVSPQVYAQVYRPQGWITPVVLVDGRVAAVWEHVKQKERLTINVTPFESLKRSVRKAILAEAHDLGRFLEAPEVQVRFG